MLFAQFYQLSTGYPDGIQKPIEACGDRSAIVLDGRYSRADNELIARQECLKRGYIGYSLHKGETFNRSTCILNMELI